MSVLFLVIPIALLLAAAAVAGFMWMARTGQLDDLDSPPLRMLWDDQPSRVQSEPAPYNPPSSGCDG